MTPRRQLILLVTVAALVIGAAWIVLFRNHALTPPSAMPGPSLTEIGQQFDASVRKLRAMTDQQAIVNAASARPASDDARAPAVP